MQLIFVGIALPLLLYAPGHYLLRRAPAGGRDAGSRLLREVLLSVSCASWFGFVLAELGIYSLGALLALLAGVSIAARGRTRTARPRYRAADAAGLGVLLLTCAWVAPPLDTRILGSDSAGYLASGIHLSRHGSLIIHDPTLAALSPDLKRALFPSVAPDRGSPPYLRLLGSLVLRSLDGDEVLPAFHHLIAVWIAVFHGLAGSHAVTWVITLFGGLSVWAMVAFAASLAGELTAALFFIFLLLLSPQYWYSRFLMPEVPAQFFLWSGLCCLSFWSRSGKRADALLAGIAFGVAGLMRVENAPFLLVAFVVVLWLTPRAHRPAPLLLAGAAAGWFHSALHLFIFRTHYLGNLYSFFRDARPTFSGSFSGIWMLVAVLVAAYLVWNRSRRAGRWQISGAAVLAAAVVCVGMWGDYRRGWWSLHLLTEYAGIPTVIGGVIGLFLGVSPAARRELSYRLLLILAALVFAQVLLEPHATPVPIWAVRRAVTVVLPAFCFGLAALCAWAAQRWHWSVAVVGLVAGMAGQIRPLQALRGEPFYLGSIRHVQAVAALIPDGACLFFAPELVTSGLAPMLWAERDLPAYLLAREDTARIRELAASLDGAPVYWLSNGTSIPPQAPDIAVTPVALYEFVLSTPKLDAGSAPLTGANWDYKIGVYSLRVVTSSAGNSTAEEGAIPSAVQH